MKFSENCCEPQDGKSQSVQKLVTQDNTPKQRYHYDLVLVDTPPKPEVKSKVGFDHSQITTVDDGRNNNAKTI